MQNSTISRQRTSPHHRGNTSSNSTTTTTTTTRNNTTFTFSINTKYVFFLIIIVQAIIIFISYHMVETYFNNGDDNTKLLFAKKDIMIAHNQDLMTMDENYKKSKSSSSSSIINEINPTKQHKQSKTHHTNFTKYDKVAIVTKVHSSEDVSKLKRTLCLLNAAYNQYVKYDIIVFTTIPWPTSKIQGLQSSIPNGKIQVAIDGHSPTGNLTEHIRLSNMTQDERSILEQRCSKPLDWFSNCTEDGMNGINSLAYNWQAEFRSYHIYLHKALKSYKYMIWMDSDAICTQPWKVDPIKLMVEHDLTIMFPNFPAGKTKHRKLRQKIEAVYNQSICHAILSREGFLWGKKCRDEEELPHFQHIHGFHHVTNLDVYRKPIHLKFLHSATVGESKFSRLWDDQLCVTVPAVMDAPGKAWDYRKHNITTNIFHHGDLDGKGHGKIKRHGKWWRSGGADKWEEGKEMCDKQVMLVTD